jgi:hypothetical protein
LAVTRATDGSADITAAIMLADCDEVSTLGPTRVKVVATGRSKTTTLTCDTFTEAAAAKPDATVPAENALMSMVSSANVTLTRLSDWPGGAGDGGGEGGGGDGSGGGDGGSGGDNNVDSSGNGGGNGGDAKGGEGGRGGGEGGRGGKGGGGDGGGSGTGKLPTVGQ